MATKYILKRKLYASDGSDNGGKKSNLLRNTLIGATAIGGSLYGAKKGLFGAGVRKTVNKGLMTAGSFARNNLGMKGMGDSMILSGATDYGKAKASMANKALLAKGKTGLTDQAKGALADKIGLNQIDKYTKSGNWAKAAAKNTTK